MEMFRIQETGQISGDIQEKACPQSALQFNKHSITIPDVLVYPSFQYFHLFVHGTVQARLIYAQYSFRNIDKPVFLRMYSL